MRHFKASGSQDKIVEKHSVTESTYPGFNSLILENSRLSELAEEAEMARLDRLNLLGKVAAGFGHEVRNPMTTVRGFLQLLSEKKECACYNEYFDLMISELDRANSIITEFLSLAKNKAIYLESKNLNDILISLYPLMQADGTLTNTYIELEMQKIPVLFVDEKEIRQLVLNLVRNGLEAMSPGGLIKISTYSEENEVVLAVKDNGGGIDSQTLEKLGTPFFTTKENGTGLGLTVCYNIATRHNASIEIESGSGGTTFFVRFKKPY
jgi:signal transduction histidine kinase